MRYDEFKDYLENSDDSSEKIYNELLKNNQKTYLDELYRRYILDDEVDDKIKYDKAEYFIENQSDIKTDENIRRDIYNENAYTQYLNSLGTIKYLSEEEKNLLYKKYYDLRKYIKENNINLDSLKQYLDDLDMENKDLLKIMYMIKERNLDTDQVNKTIKELELMIEEENLRKKIMEQNLRLVIKVVRIAFTNKFGYSKGACDVMDAIQAGNLGLKTAIEKYDINSGYKFSTYAYRWIAQSIGRTVHNEAATIRIPVHLYEANNKLNMFKQKFLETNGRDATDEELCKEFKITVKQLRYIEGANNQVTSLDSYLSVDEQETTIIDMIADPKNIEDDIIDSDNARDISQYILYSNLNDAELTVILFRFGLDPERYNCKDKVINYLNKFGDGEKAYKKLLIKKEATLDDLGKATDKTRERIRQIEVSGKRKLIVSSRFVNNMLNYKNSNQGPVIDKREFEKTLKELIELSNKLNGVSDISLIKRIEVFGCKVNSRLTPNEIEKIIEKLKLCQNTDRLIKTLEEYSKFQTLKSKVVQYYKPMMFEFTKKVLIKRKVNFDNLDIKSLLKNVNDTLELGVSKYYLYNEELRDKKIKMLVERSVSSYINANKLKIKNYKKI